MRFIDNGWPSVPTDPCWFNPAGSRPGQREERPSQGREKGSWMFGCVNRLATLPFKHKLPWACLSTSTAPGFALTDLGCRKLLNPGCPSCRGRRVVESVKHTALPVLPLSLGTVVVHPPGISNFQTEQMLRVHEKTIRV